MMFCACAGAPIVTRELAAIDDVRIERIRNDVTIFFSADRMPFAESYLAVVAAAGDAQPNRSPAGRCTVDKETRCRH